MSTRSTESSSQTWSADERAPTNIIDLDKFMHNTVRATTTRRREPPDTRREVKGLVVDAGGVERKVPGVGGAASGAAGGAGAGAAPAPALMGTAPRRSAGSTPPHNKRFSHDSGLSDGSIRHRKQRTLRRGGSEANRRTPTSWRAVHSGVSASSLRAFRALCERALCDQQTLIVRVAELCERLAERPAPAGLTGGARSRSSSRSSDSSSTRTTASKYAVRRDKQRSVPQSGEFKTYKLIMSKLDDMSRLLAVRARRPHRAASSGSVTVSDKLVATEPAPLQVARGRRGTNEPSPYAPKNPRVNVTAYRALIGERDRGAYAHNARFNHDDTMHVYSVPQRLHATALKRRALSMGAHLEACGDERDRYKRDLSLCALCRFYWRTFRQYLSAQICSPAHQ